MIRRLRLKFIMTAFLAVLAVLVVLVGGINVSNYVNVVRDSDKVLRMLAENDGRFPDRMTKPGNEEPEQAKPPEERRGERIDSPEIAYETRYFTVRYDSDGNVISVDTEKVSAVSEDMATELAGKVPVEDGSEGFIGDYRYLNICPCDGERLVIFCDRGASLVNFRDFRNSSIILSAFTLLVVGVIIYFVSGVAVRPVSEAYDKQKRFISDAGHEIKTPLAVIKADAEVLGMEMGEDNEWLTDISKQTDRLTELTNDLIALSKMEEGSTTLIMAETDVSALAMDAVDSVKALAMIQNKELTSDVEDGVRITCDRKSVYELMSILLDNAVKYCPEGGNIRFLLKSTGKKVHISVSNDTNDIIEDEALDRIFDRFYRTDSSRNSETGGFGIGLSMASAITEAHHGRITATSEGDRSITFTVVI
ncbi:MAG: HAMP domain-containing histidine kinase [Lachnospiraceae bacterium]|nr:HAMP domain-containing histidine kinase [Lachnospiraceae bacterium]